jgi:KaiC domain protein
MSDENGDEGDWFERALREMEAEDAEAEAAEDAEAEAAEDAEAEAAEDAEAESEDIGEESAADFGMGDGADEESAADFGMGGEAAEKDGDFGMGDGADEEADSDDGSPFGEDFASAFENAPQPDFGDESGGGEDFGFGGGGPDEDFGFGGAPGGGGGTSFDEEAEDFESGIDRIELGIEGLDQMILGGIPERSLLVAIGSAGTGKTTFALQFLYKALTNGERGVYITLEETREDIFETAEEKGWEFREYAEKGQLAVIHLNPIEMANSLANIRNDLPRLVEEFEADRLVLDSVSLLEMMYDRPSERRTEVFEFTQALKDAGVTTMVTSEASENNPYNSRYGIIEYLSDAVFVLQYVRPSDFRETRLAVEIQKIRDASHSRETKPYELTNEGISVYRQANIF